MYVDSITLPRTLHSTGTHNAPTKFAPSPIRANEGPDQGIRLKFCPQGRGILFACVKLRL